MGGSFGICLTFFLKTGFAASAGDGNLSLAPGNPQLLAAVGTAEIAVLFVLVDVCVFCCNVSTIILRLWGQGGNE